MPSSRALIYKDDTVALTSALMAAALAQVVITAGSMPALVHKLAILPWTERDTADAAALRSAYEQHPVGHLLAEYRVRIYWREPGAGGAMNALWLKFFDGPDGDFLVQSDKRPQVFDGGCWVVQARAEASGKVTFTCNGEA